VNSHVSPSEASDPAVLVVPIDWKRFEQPPRDDEHYHRSRQMLLNAARYNVVWMPGAAENIERNWRKLSGRQNHDVIRLAN
jgi:hypothetical protein